MKQRFWLFKRGNVYYVQDSETGKQQSLDVTDKLEAQRLRAAKEEAIGQKTLNLAVGRAYLAASDPSLVTRTWNMVMEKLCARAKKDTSRERNVREMASRPFDFIRRKKLIETTAEDFARVGSGKGLHQPLSAVPAQSGIGPWLAALASARSRVLAQG